MSNYVLNNTAKLYAQERMLNKHFSIFGEELKVNIHSVINANGKLYFSVARESEVSLLQSARKRNGSVHEYMLEVLHRYEKKPTQAKMHKRRIANFKKWVIKIQRNKMVDK